MHLKKILSYLIFLLLSCASLIAFSSNAHIAASNKNVGPILTPINGLTVTTAAGQITITNSSGADIPVTSMLLSFSLDQTSIASAWGTPWLNWQPFTSSLKNKKAALSYQFVNQVNLPNAIFSAGSSITFQYTPTPWNNTAAPTNVQLFNLSYPLVPASITSSVSESGGINTITITNTSGSTLNLNSAQLQMTYQGQVGTSIWGTPYANWLVTTGSPNYVLTAGTAAQIPASGTLIVSFQGVANPITNISLWVQSSGSATLGGITVNVPPAPAASLPNPVITITGPSFPQGNHVTATWGQALPITNLQIGSYTLATPDIQTSNQAFKAMFSQNPVVVSSSTPININLSYTAKALGVLNVRMPVAPATGVSAPTITVQGPDFPTATHFQTTWGNTLQICTNGATSCAGLTPGNYTVTLPNVYSQTDAFSASGFTNPVVLNSGQTNTLPVSYAPIPQGPFTVTINAPSLKKKKSVKNVNYAVTFTNLEGSVYTKNLSGGANTVSLPINDTYQIAAPNVAGQVSSVTPSSIAVTQTGTPSVIIQYTAGAPTQFVVYYGGWEGDEFDLNTNLPSNVTAVNLAFANITSSLAVDTAASGWLTNPPAPNVTMQPSYINWTVYKYNHPKTKILLSVGGSTYSAIWNSVLTASNADAMAQSIAAVVNATYPVYKGNISSPSNLLGNVSIDGVDLDVETGVRLADNISSNVALLVTSLKRYLNPGKLITFAAFSVGADPNNSQCTVAGSVHCGEDISLLQTVGSQFDWINVMAYDAGQVYATSLYQTALANYATYMPKSKILLGLDIQTQWPGFNETAAQLAVKAAWQMQNGYAGAMFWGVGVQNNPTQELQFVTAISQAL